jgi:biopolymer transport protein TolR
MAGIIPAAGAVSSGSKFRRRRYTPIADINVTPLVDVMLVLLIIFMITAPLLQVGVPVDLPKTSAQQVGGKDEPLVVSVNAQGEVFLGETKYELAELSTKLKAVHEEKPDQRVFMRGDKAVDYGKMMEVMGVVIDSGFRQLGLLGEQAQQLGKGAGGTVTMKMISSTRLRTTSGETMMSAIGPPHLEVTAMDRSCA